MANVKYNSFKRDLATGVINLSSSGIMCMLVSSAYVPDQDAHTNISQVTGQITGTGYTAGGKLLTNKTVVIDNTNDLAKFDADDVTWAAATFTARAAVLYKQTSGELIAYMDFGVDTSATNGDFIVQWNAAGILTIS